jgi:hypothetical protein
VDVRKYVLAAAVRSFWEEPKDAEARVRQAGIAASQRVFTSLLSHDIANAIKLTKSWVNRICHG